MKNLCLLLTALLYSFSSMAVIGPITGTNSVCVGGTTTLANSTMGGSWACASIMATVDAGGVVTGTAAGTAVVTYTAGTETATTVVTVSPAPSIPGSGNYCVGATDNIYVGVSGGTWSSSNTAVGTVTGSGSSGILSSISAGTTTLTYAVSAGCSVVRTITVNTLPAAITGATGVCMGSTTTLSNATPGGTWSGGVYWVATITPTSGVVTGAGAGTTTVSYRNPAGCYRVATISVAGATAAITGGTSVCTGATASLSFLAGGGTWSSSTPSVASISSSTGVVTGVIPGTSVITYITGGCSAPITTTVTVTSALPPITGLPAVCYFNNTTLSNAMGGGTWSSGTTSIATVGSATGIVSGIVAGTSVITYHTTSCGIATKTVTVEGTIGSITASGGYLCGSGTVTLSNLSPGGTWSTSTPTVATIGLTTGIVTGASPANPSYGSFTYTLPSGCMAYFSMKIYPGPGTLTGCNNVAVGDTIKFFHPLYSTWGSSNTGKATVNSTGRVTGVSAGTAIITNYSPYTGCVQGTKTVSITPTALVKQMKGHNLICQGETTTVTDAISGGVWSTANPSIATVSTAGVVTGVGGGQTLLIYSNTAGTASCTRDLYVNSLPEPMTGPTTACVGDMVTLHANPSPYGAPRWWIAPDTNYSPANICTPDIYYTWGYPPPIIFDCGSYIPSSLYTSSDTNIAKPGYYNTSGTIQAASAGVATITYTQGNTHCTATRSLTVNASGVAPITGTAIACVGGTTTLANTTSGGTWSSSNTAIGTVNSTTGVVTGISQGIVTISYNTGVACGVATKQVTVSPQPGAITGNPGNMCIGATATLASATAGGTWGSSSPAVASVSSAGVVSALTAGTTIITYTSGPCGTYVTTTINVNAGYATSGTPNICAGSSTTFSNATPGGTWSTSNASIATVTAAGVVAGVDGGTAIISYNTAYCGSATKTVTVYPLMPIAGPTGVCNGITATLSNPVPGGTWSSSNPTVASIDGSGAVTAHVASGGFTVTYTLPTGCKTTKLLSIAASPTKYNMYGGGSYCTGGAGVQVWLLSSNTGVSYQLYLGTTPVGAAMAGTGGPLDFGFKTVPGDYTVVGTHAISACSAGMNGVATVSIVSSPAAITGASSACVGGGAITLSTTTAGGTWSSGSTAIATVTAAGVVNPVSAGTVTISYNTPCGVATKTVTINAALSAITGPTSVCSGSTITLSIAATGGTWSSSNPAAASIDPSTGVLTGHTFDWVFISYVSPAGCASNYFVTSYESPVVTGPSGMCTGDTATLVSSWPSGTWSSSVPAIASIHAAGKVTAVSVGTSVISFVGSLGCTGTYSAVVTTGCTGTPTAGAAVLTSTLTCGSLYGTVALTGAAPACGLAYQWQKSNDGTTWATVAGATNTTYTGTLSSPMYRVSTTCISGGATVYSTPCHIAPNYTITTYSIVATPGTACSSGHFYVQSCAYDTSLTVVSYFGDGTADSTPLTAIWMGGTADVLHAYSLPGTYTIKHILYSGAVAQDSVVFSYEHIHCSVLPIKLYQDINSSCTMDAGESFNAFPVTMAIDSNGVTLDTIIITSGMYYKAYGGPGTVYSFKVLSVSGGRVVTCPSSGVLYDTISSTVSSYATKYFALGCGTSTSYDLSESITMVCRPGFANGVIYVGNSYCTSVTPTVTMHMSPKYAYASSVPAAASVSGGTITWNLSPVGATGSPVDVVSVHFVNATTLVPGDTIHADALATPLTSDVNTANNYVALVNTVMAAYDPNDIDVSPRGRILPCQQLQYTVRFENTGNDTAHNIYVLDTLSDNLDPASLNVVMASAAMDISVTSSGGYNIARFDFPNIKLLDSSHHGMCDGLFIFNIKAKNPLADGTVINNRVGIYFDDNAPVLTNTVSNTIGIDTIAGPGNVCAGSTVTLSNATNGGTWASGSAAAAVSGVGVVSGVSPGASVISYTVSNGCASRTATKTITVNVTPSVSPITGSPSVCVGASASLSWLYAGGAWSSSSTGIATVSASGVVSGLAIGTTTVSYNFANGCGSALNTKVITVNTLPATGTITGITSICVGATTTLGSTVTGGSWTVGSGTTAISISSVGVVSGLAAGTATVFYHISNSCGANATTVVVTVNAMPSAGAISGAASVCAGATTTLAGSASGGAWSCGTPLIGSITSSGIFTGSSAGVATISYAVSNTCGTAIAIRSVTVNPIIVPSVVISTGSGSTVCSGVVSFSAMPTDGGISPSFTWRVNGALAGTGPTYSYSPSSGDVVRVRMLSSAMCAVPDSAISVMPLTVVPTGLPTVSFAGAPTGPVCQGELVSFTASSSFGGSAPTYKWIKNGALASTGSSYAYVPVNGDVVYCKLTSDYLCRVVDTAVSSTAVLAVDSAYVPAITVIATPGLYIPYGQPDTLNAIVTGGGPTLKYQWLKNGVLIPGATTSQYIFNVGDRDSICCQVTGSGICELSSFNCVVAEGSITSITSASHANTLAVFPNPSNGIIAIKGNAPEGISTIEITNTLGQTVYKKPVEARSGLVDEQIQLSSNLPNGMYVLIVRSATANSAFYFVLKRD